MKNVNTPVIEAYACIQTEGSKAGYPHILLRTTGCTHRCYFGEGGWCDSWYTSIHPEKASFSWPEIHQVFEQYPHIKHLMITGGSPTMHPRFIREVMEVANIKGLFVTLETEGSHLLPTDLEKKVDLLSLSPKFSNSVPKLGVATPQGVLVDEKMILQHNKFRLSVGTIRRLLIQCKDYHIKPVIDRKVDIWNELEDFLATHNIPGNKVWLMPAGSTRGELIPNYAYVMEEAIKRGYNFSGRPHIIAYNDKRGV